MVELEAGNKEEIRKLHPLEPKDPMGMVFGRMLFWLWWLKAGGCRSWMPLL